jgi:hypothetical protein
MARPGCFNWSRNCASGTTPKLAIWLRTYVQWSRQQWSGLKDWLPKLSHPVRIGEHSQSAFALGLALDYARTTSDRKFADLAELKARQFYLGDRNCPFSL